MVNEIYLVGGDWNHGFLWLSIQLGISWSELTSSYFFQRGRSITNQIKWLCFRNWFSEKPCPIQTAKKTYEKPWTMTIPVGDDGAKISIFKNSQFPRVSIHKWMNKRFKNKIWSIKLPAGRILKLTVVVIITHNFSRVQNQCWLMISCGIILTNTLGIRIK